MTFVGGNMSTLQAIFGTDHPSPRRVAAFAAALALVLVALYGWTVPFVPLEIWHGWSGVVLALVPAAALVAIVGAVLAHSPTPGSRGLLAGLVVIGVPLLAGAIWLAGAKTLPVAWTRLAGEDWRQHAQVRVVSRMIGRGCAYRIHGGSLAISHPGHLCISRKDFELHHGDQVRVVLLGRSSALGVLIQSVKFEDGRQ